MMEEVSEDYLKDDGGNEGDGKDSGEKQDDESCVKEAGEAAFLCASWGSQLPPATPQSSKLLPPWRPWKPRSEKKRSPASAARSLRVCESSSGGETSSVSQTSRTAHLCPPQGIGEKSASPNASANARPLQLPPLIARFLLFPPPCLVARLSPVSPHGQVARLHLDRFPV